MYATHCFLQKVAANQLMLSFVKKTYSHVQLASLYFSLQYYYLSTSSAEGMHSKTDPSLKLNHIEPFSVFPQSLQIAVLFFQFKHLTGTRSTRFFWNAWGESIVCQNQWTNFFIQLNIEVWWASSFLHLNLSKCYSYLFGISIS